MLSSGKMTRSQLRSSACRASASACSTLNVTSPDEPVGLAAATRTKPCRWIASNGAFFVTSEHLRHHLDRDRHALDPRSTAAAGAEMLLAMGGDPTRPGAAEMDEARLVPCVGEAGDGERDMGAGAGERAFGHGEGDLLRDRPLRVDQLHRHAE